MGVAPSIPTTSDEATTTLRVIGGGYIRTGTLSISMACSRLLNGPAWHGGAQVLGREDSYVRLLAQCYAARAAGDKALLHKLLRQATKGFVSTCDFPMAQFAPDLLEIYPDAIVLVTTRNKERWWESAEPVAANAQSWFLDVLLWPCPGWRWWPTLIKGVRETEGANCGFAVRPDTILPTKDSISDQEDWLRRTIPKDKLYFYEVKDGWGPLCKILNVPVPAEPFPRANDGDAAESVFKGLVLRAGLLWLGLIGTVAVSGHMLWKSL